MRLYKLSAFVLVFALLFSTAPLKTTNAAPAAQEAEGQYVRQLTRRGTTFLPAASMGTGSLSRPEFPGVSSGEVQSQDKNLAPTPGFRSGLNGVGNRSYSPRPEAVLPEALPAELSMNTTDNDRMPVPEVESTPIENSSPGLDQSFEGLNHFDQRSANNGNQFSLEPPDQGLCVGNGFVMETVNSVVEIFDTSGNSVSGPIAMNTFYGYPPAIDRTNVVFGPFMFDPSCYYDPEYQRWYHIAVRIDVDPATGEQPGTNWLDLAISQSADPTGAWNLYSIPAHNNGQDGTPDHNCSEGFCFGDYPQIGADKYGFYIATNEYSFFGPEFTTAQIYALSKAELAAGVENPTLVHLDKLKIEGTPGFTVVPALSPEGQYFTGEGGVEFFLSSMAAAETGNKSGMADHIGVWGLFNTSSLDTRNPKLELRKSVVKVGVYGLPPFSEQKEGPFPLGECINDTEIKTEAGKGCWQLIFPPEEEPKHNEKISRLDSSDTRMFRTWYVNGRLMGALDTILKVDGEVQAGIAYYILGPSDELVSKDVPIVHGYLATEDNNVIYPAIAVLPSGEGVMVLSLVGENYYPSAAYTPFHQEKGPGKIYIAREGQAPSDGFTGYKAFGDPFPRWGDYSAAVTDGETIWMATEYIESRCNLRQFAQDQTCGGTRTALANWSTRVMLYTPPLE